MYCALHYLVSTYLNQNSCFPVFSIVTGQRGSHKMSRTGFEGVNKQQPYYFYTQIVGIAFTHGPGSAVSSCPHETIAGHLQLPQDSSFSSYSWAKCIFQLHEEECPLFLQVTRIIELGGLEPVRDQHGFQLVLWVLICYCSPSFHSHLSFQTDCTTALRPSKRCPNNSRKQTT